MEKSDPNSAPNADEHLKNLPFHLESKSIFSVSNTFNQTNKLTFAIKMHLHFEPLPYHLPPFHPP